MLTSDTKRRIDSCRDVLVGKLPLPTDQVELITIALIYKFMDDLDEESIKLGGKPSFFVGPLKKYRWRALMPQTVSAEERMNLFAEGIETLAGTRKPDGNDLAGHLPIVFRDIFRNAFLKFRDGRILTMFLTDLNGFEYSHSEELGNAFEYLLQCMGTQGENGQFRTPRHIIDFMVSCLNPQPRDRILDPACGTGGFLVSCYKHILAQHTSPKAKTPGDKLTHAQRKQVYGNLTGYDVTDLMVKLSKVNLFLHGFPDPAIHIYDTLSNDARWHEKADLILANPPFMTPKGGVTPHSKFGIAAKKAEVLFTDYIAEHLSPDGRAGIIVPEGIIFQSQTAYKALRKLLVENSLVAVVSLPAGCFNPYSGVKTSILFLDKSLARQSDTIGFFKVENDGFGLGAQRRAIEQNDLPQVQADLASYLNSLRSKAAPETLALTSAQIVPKEKIAANGEYSLSGERYREGIVQNHVYPIVSLEDICEIIMGQSPPGDTYNTKGEGVPLINGPVEFGPEPLSKTLINQYTTAPTKMCREGDLILCVRGSTTGRMNIAGYAGCLGRGVAAIRSETSQEWVNILINSMRDRIYDLGVGSTFPSIKAMDLASLQIPLPPLEVQREIVAEIEGYQKVIDGARAVLDHYRPHIPIHPDWPMVELGEVCDIKTGKLNSNAAVEDGAYPFFTCSKEVFRIDHYAFDCEAILLSGNNASGDFDVKYHHGKFNAYQRTYVITVRTEFLERMTYGILKYVLNANLLDLKQKSIGGLTRYLTLPMITSIKLPLPPLATQQAIVAEIEAEQALVNGNRELITRFEQKIQATLARIWGTADVE